MELMTKQTKIIEHHCCHLLDNDQLARKEKKKKEKERKRIQYQSCKAVY